MEAYKKVLWISTIVVILLIIPLIIYFFVIKSPSSDSGTMGAPVDSAEKIPTAAVSDRGSQPGNIPAGNGIEAPTPRVLDIKLNNSDEPVRELVNGCSSHPDFPQWLKHKNLVRRIVAVVDNIAGGVSPASHLQFLTPAGEFKVIKKEGTVLLDPTGYIRYQPLTMVLASIDCRKLAQVYRQLSPVLEEAYGELGYPGEKFQAALAKAIKILLDTPIIEGDIFLEEKVTTYTFADSRLEGLTEAQKHLLRMGPENTRKIQAKLRELLTALEQ